MTKEENARLLNAFMNGYAPQQPSHNKAAAIPPHKKKPPRLTKPLKRI
jgi:hypothetical protein